MSVRLRILVLGLAAVAMAAAGSAAQHPAAGREAAFLGACSCKAGATPQCTAHLTEPQRRRRGAAVAAAGPSVTTGSGRNACRAGTGGTAAERGREAAHGSGRRLGRPVCAVSPPSATRAAPVT